jgi:DUF2911 family protein
MVPGRRAVTRAVVIAGLGLLAGPLLAPRLSFPWILIASALWYGALAVLLWSALQILSTRMARKSAMVVVGLAVGFPVFLTAIRPGPLLATRLPCPRNWGWLPTWMLRSSPLVSLSFEVGEARVKLCYGQPAARGRRMLGGSRVPYGRLWRTGANEPTTLITTASIEVAGITVPPGRTALYTIPGPESWELILTSATSQWGIESEYTPAVRSRELGRAILPSARGEQVERLTWSSESELRGDSDLTELVLAWETTRLRIPLRAALR